MRLSETSSAAGIVAAAVVLPLVGCGSPTETVSIPQERAADALCSELENAGLDVTWLAASQRSDFFDSAVRRVALQIDGPCGSVVNVYGFPDVEQAAAGVARVSRDGMQVPVGGGLASVSWTGRPHFFRQGRLIALFCESGDSQPVTRRDRVVLAALRKVMGPQFAGLSCE
jgi:hypothetical protein